MYGIVLGKVCGSWLTVFEFQKMSHVGEDRNIFQDCVRFLERVCS